MTDGAQGTLPRRWTDAAGRQSTGLLAGILAWWRGRRREIRVSRLSDDWLRAHEAEAVKHRTEPGRSW